MALCKYGPRVIVGGTVAYARGDVVGDHVVHFLGSGAAATVQRLITNDVARLENGRAFYTVACLPSGGIVDDLIVYRLQPDHYVVVVNAKVPIASVRELVDYAKKNPGKLSFGSSGTGAASHLSAELFKSMANVDMLHVPYKGTGQAVTDLVGGQIDVMFSPAETVMQHVQAGRLKALAVTSAKRFAALPDLPTVAEAGVPGYEAIGWFGLFAAAATPKDLVAKISADANKVLADPDILQQMHTLGFDPAPETPDQLADEIRGDAKKYGELVRRTGATAD